MKVGDYIRYAQNDDGIIYVIVEINGDRGFMRPSQLEVGNRAHDPFPRGRCRGRVTAHSSSRKAQQREAAMTYTEYKALMAAAMRLPVNPLIPSDVAALDALVVQIEAAEAEHPEYDEMLCRGE